MSNLTVKGNASGTGTVILEAPNTNSNRTITLPDAATTLVGTDATQTLTNKTIQGGALTLGTAVASTSGTSIDFTGIPSWAKRVTVMLKGVSTNGSSLIRFQLGTSGGVESSGYTAVCSFVAVSSASSATSSSGFDSFSDANSAYVRHGQLIFSLVGSNAWVLTGAYIITGSSTYLFTGSKTLSATLDRVRITTVNGTDTFDAGTINIMWEG